MHADMASPAGAGRQVGVGNWWFDARGRLVGHEWAYVPLTPEVADDVEMFLWMRDNP